MKRQDFQKLKFPQNPGVYFFKDQNGGILYIGRATSLHDRVYSYFSNDLIVTRGPLLVDMVTKAHTIDYKEVDSVLEAIILESIEIKKHQPYFNTKYKDNKSYNFVIITDEEFPRVIVVRGRTLDKLDEEALKFKTKYQFGPYPQGSLLRDALKIIRKIFPFRDAKATLSHHESFYRAIGLSPAVGSPEAKKEYHKTIRNLILFFQGKKEQLIVTLKKEMKEHAKKREFEMAQNVRNTLYALEHIQDVSLVKREENRGITGFRIEAYDIAHMSGKNNVGVMTVVTDGEAQKSEYRKFKISREVNDDTAAIKEVLIRRFNHPEWRFPDLIVVDGGLSQINIAKSVVKDIPLVSVVKNNSHKPNYFLGDEALAKTHTKSILLANSEAHRFAINYHKRLRNKGFINRLA